MAIDMKSLMDLAKEHKGAALVAAIVLILIGVTFGTLFMGLQKEQRQLWQDRLEKLQSDLDQERVRNEAEKTKQSQHNAWVQDQLAHLRGGFSELSPAIQEVGDCFSDAVSEDALSNTLTKRLRSAVSTLGGAAVTIQLTLERLEGSAQTFDRLTTASTDEALSTVDQWARAWAEQDLDQYLAAYSQSFEPADGLDRQTWEDQRRARVSSPGYIFLKLGELEPKLIGSDAVEVSFDQKYVSDSYSDTVRKSLVLQRETAAQNDTGSIWRIVQEKTFSG